MREYLIFFTYKEKLVDYQNSCWLIFWLIIVALDKTESRQIRFSSRAGRDDTFHVISKPFHQLTLRFRVYLKIVLLVHKSADALAPVFSEMPLMYELWFPLTWNFQFILSEGQKPLEQQLVTEEQEVLISLNITLKSPLSAYKIPMRFSSFILILLIPCGVSNYFAVYIFLLS